MSDGVLSRRVQVFLPRGVDAVIGGVGRYARPDRPWLVQVLEQPGVGPEALASSEADGVMARVWPGAWAEAARACRSPVVEVMTSVMSQAVPSVQSDERAAGRLAAEHLIDRGLRRFGFVADVGSSFALEREAGFNEALEDAGFACSSMPRESMSVEGLRQSTQGERVMADWLGALDRPIGVLTHKPVVGLQLTQVCWQIGLRVPEDVAIVTVGDDPSLCELATPAMTAVTVDHERVGYEAARMLEALMSGEPLAARHLIVPPLGITERQSTDTAAVADREVAAAMRFIDTHAHERIDVNDVVEATAVSRRPLERRFQKHLGRSPAEQLRRVRLNRARELLARTNLSIDAIAHRCGLASATRLGELFGRHLKLTPTEYRRRRQPSDHAP